MANVSKFARDKVVALMADDTVGFNPRLSTVVDSYGIKGFTIDFGAKSKSFFQGYLNPADIVQTTTTPPNFMILYGMKSENQNLEKFLTFAGAIRFGIDTCISFPSAQAPGAADDIIDAVESTLYTVFNSSANQSFFSPYGIIYNGAISMRRNPVGMVKQNWGQVLHTEVDFDLLLP